MTTHTLGLSFKEPSGFGFDKLKSRILLLDTAGTMAPVTQSRHSEQSANVDRMEVETFLTEVILDLSVNVIYVVNDLTWPEQQFIDSILKVRRAKKNARALDPGVDDILIVVHNWRYQNHDQMETQFNDFVKLCYPVGEKVLLGAEGDAFYWSSKVERTEGSHNETFVLEHFFLASEVNGDVEANRRWNDITLDQIRRSITNVPPIIASKKRMILKEVVSQINSRLKNYLVLSEQGKTAKDLVHLVVQDNVPRVSLKNPEEVVRKKHFHVPVCIPQPQKQADLEPPYVVYMTKKHVVVRIEVPGLDSLGKIRYTPKQGMLEVSGDKPSLDAIEDEHEVRTLLEGNKNPTSGSWYVLVNLRSLDDMLIEKDLRINNGKPEEISLKSGVLVFKYAFGDGGATKRFSDEDVYKELAQCKAACEKSSSSSKFSWGASCMQVLEQRRHAETPPVTNLEDLQKTLKAQQQAKEEEDEFRRRREDL